jgi:hypothetical protein
MIHYKLHLEDDGEEDFILIAIHCSEEAYKMAFMMNKHLSMQLQRKRKDLKLINDDVISSFSLYEYENEQQYTQFYLVENKCKLTFEKFHAVGSLFEDGNSEKMTVTHFLPEFKKVDYFLKIESDFEKFPLRKTLAQINEIKEVISAYVIENQNIKSQNNLIFN